MLLNEVMEEIKDLEEKLSAYVKRITELKDKSPEERRLLSNDLENLDKSLQIEQKILEMVMFFEKVPIIAERFYIMRDFFVRSFVDPQHHENKESENIENPQTNNPKEVKFPKKKE